MESKEFIWLREHYAELQEKYPGKVVAIVGDKVVGVGDSISEVEKQLKGVAEKPLFGKIRRKRAMIL